MIVFLDTEFTALDAAPLLLSVGIVCGDGPGTDFYVEVTDGERLRSSSTFAAKIVLTQFGKVPGAGCPYLEAGARLGAYFADLAKSLRPGHTIEVAFESDVDWTLVQRAIEDADASFRQGLSSVLRPMNVYNAPGFAKGELAARRYFESQRLAPFGRHHALCDARALRIAYGAATAPPASPAAPPLSERRQVADAQTRALTAPTQGREA